MVNQKKCKNFQKFFWQDSYKGQQGNNNTTYTYLSGTATTAGEREKIPQHHKNSRKLRNKHSLHQTRYLSCTPKRLRRHPKLAKHLTSSYHSRKKFFLHTQALNCVISLTTPQHHFAKSLTKELDFTFLSLFPFFYPSGQCIP